MNNTNLAQQTVRLSIPYYKAANAQEVSVTVTPLYETQNFFVVRSDTLHPESLESLFKYLAVYHKRTGLFLARYWGLETCKFFMAELEALGDWSQIDSVESARASGMGASYAKIRDKWDEWQWTEDE